MQFINTDLEPLRLAIQLFEINDPIKSLFMPSFTVARSFSENETIITLQIRAPDSTGQREMVPVYLQRIVPMYLFVAESKAVAGFLRKMLHEILLHEADESISWAGKRIFDPHRGE